MIAVQAIAIAAFLAGIVVAENATLVILAVMARRKRNVKRLSGIRCKHWTAAEILK